jgi:hypothetical protein
VRHLGAGLSKEKKSEYHAGLAQVFVPQSVMPQRPHA